MFAGLVDGDIAAPVVPREIEAALFQRMGEGRGIVRDRLGILYGAFDGVWIFVLPFGLLPFLMRKAVRIALRMIRHALGHPPT